MGASVEIKQALHHALALRQIEDDLDHNDPHRARERAAREVERVFRQAAGVPLVLAAECLRLSVPSVRRLRDCGVIERHSPDGPKLELKSVLDVYWRLEGLRADGRRRGLVERLAQEAADRRFLRDPGLSEGIAAMRRGDYLVVED